MNAITDIPSVQHLQQLVLNKIITLKNILEEIEKSVPRFGPLFFLYALKLIVEAIETSFDKQVERFKKKPDDKKLRTQCLRHFSHIQEIHKNYLGLIQNIETSFVRPEFQSSITKFIEQFQPDNFGLFLRPSWNYNYEILCFIDFVNEELRDYEPQQLGQKIRDGATRFPEWFVFVFYPCLEHKNTLLNTLIAHEVGHFVDYNFNIHTLALPHFRFDKQRIKNLVKERLKQPVGTQLTLGDIIEKEDFTKMERFIQSQTDRCLVILKKWLQEFIADILAVRYMGPSYFFAMYELAAMSAEGIEPYSNTHPAWRIRLLTILDELENLSFFGSQSKYYHLAKYLKNTKRNLYKKSLLEPHNKHDPDNEYHRVVYHSLFTSGAIQVLQRMLRIKTTAFAYNESRHHRDADKLISCLRDGIPPQEIWDGTTGEPASIPSIMNAGWQVYLDPKDRKSFFQTVSAHTSEDESLALANFNELLLKAVESSYTVLEWNRLKNEWEKKQKRG